MPMRCSKRRKRIRSRRSDPDELGAVTQSTPIEPGQQLLTLCPGDYPEGQEQGAGNDMVGVGCSLEKPGILQRRLPCNNAVEQRPGSCLSQRTVLGRISMRHRLAPGWHRCSGGVLRPLIASFAATAIAPRQPEIRSFRVCGQVEWVGGATSRCRRGLRHRS